MEAASILAIVSLIIAILALFAAVAQVNLAASVEERRKGKTDKLALGDWAISWPQLRSMVFEILSLLHIPSPFGDPRVVRVPYITAGALEDCFRKEATAKNRSEIRRRIRTRLVESATVAIAISAGGFSDRLYAVQATTRKRSEACWSDAMDMCGIDPKYWPLTTGASAMACDGAIRPASAVTNFHSLLKFARIMGLRSVKHADTRITLTNGGASIHLDLATDVDKPTILAHFSGSVTGRYNILEEMSHHTAESVYADSRWSEGHVPFPSRLEPKSVATHYQFPTLRDARRRIIWPSYVHPPTITRNDEKSAGQFANWATKFYITYTESCKLAESGNIGYCELIEANEPAVVSCIRTYPKKGLSDELVTSCNNALVWCIAHWWRDPYQLNQISTMGPDLPRQPQPDTNRIDAQFVTGRSQALLWYNAVNGQQSVPVGATCWDRCARLNDKLGRRGFIPVEPAEQALLVKMLQCWKIHLFRDVLYEPKLPLSPYEVSSPSATRKCEMLLLAMAQVALATESYVVGSKESNKVLEIELG